MLVVGLDPSYPPFEYLGAQGTPEGYDVELAEALAESIGVKPVFVSLDFNSLYDAIKSGKLDVAISSLEPAPEYLDQLRFSRPYYNAGQVLLVDQGFEGARELRDLAGYTVGVEASSEGDLKLRELTPQISGLRVHAYSTQEALFEALSDGEVAGAVTDRVAAAIQSHRVGGTVVGPAITDVPFVVVARRCDVSLADALDRSLEELDSRGFLAELEGKWLR